MTGILIFFLFSLAGLLTLLMLYLYINMTRRFHVYEVPNARSSHKKPVLVGGGWPLLLVPLLIFWIVTPNLSQSGVVLCLVALGLAIVSWFDDVRPLSAGVRLVFQFLAVISMLALIPLEESILHSSLPWQIDRFFVVLGWVWLINLYNFMDGIDGLAASETISICAGVLLIGYSVGLADAWLLLSVFLAGAALGFLYLNWHPAKIIMGDVGSIPLGFLVGWLLIQLSLEGYGIAAFILPLFFWSDATLTIAKRIVRGENFLTPHRQHFYQMPVVAGHPHSHVVTRVIVANILIVLCAFAASYWPVAGLITSVGVVSLLLMKLNALGSKNAE